MQIISNDRGLCATCPRQKAIGETNPVRSIDGYHGQCTDNIDMLTSRFQLQKRETYKYIRTCYFIIAPMHNNFILRVVNLVESDRVLRPTATIVSCQSQSRCTSTRRTSTGFEDNLPRPNLPRKTTLKLSN